MKKIATLLAIVFLMIGCQTEKTAFVDTEKIFKDYAELTDVKERFTKQNDEILSDLELKIKAYQIKEDLFRKNGPSMARN